MHLLGFDHTHATAEELEAISDTIWKADNVELTTVGVDVGSSTSHLMFARVHLQRLSEALSSRFVVVARDILWRSPILLTPYVSDNTIDADKLKEFIDNAYSEANLTPDDIDSGAVILTGEALKRRNSRAIADLFAEESGKFVCASAGHNLEALMAAHGSGAVALSRQEHKTFLNVDVGGGTTKLALLHGGSIRGNAAFAVGGRLIAFDDDGALIRIEGPAFDIAKEAGVDLVLGNKLSIEDRKKMVDTMVDVIVAHVTDQVKDGLATTLALTPLIEYKPKPDVITFSGGVAEYIYDREKTNFNDLGRDLADGISRALADGRIELPIYDPGQGIRATVIGASQFSVQVSGNTVSVSEGALPMRNIPVVLLNLEMGETISADDVTANIRDAMTRFDVREGKTDVALAFHWKGLPLHSRIFALAQGIVRGLAKTIEAGKPVVVMMEGDIGRTMGEILRRELDIKNDIISIDAVQLQEFDYVDIGEMIQPTHVVPLVIKSLLFATPSKRSQVK